MVTHAAVVRMMFVPIGAEVGPRRSIRLKILPKGTTSFPGIILSAPVLAPAPVGLGLRTEKHAHVLQTLGVCLPRLEEVVETRLQQEQVQVSFMLDTDQLHLEPGATALVPVRASTPYAGVRYADDHPLSEVTLAAVGPVTRTEAMLMISNTSPFSLELERGQPVARALRADQVKLPKEACVDTASSEVPFQSEPDTIMTQYPVGSVGCPYVEPVPSSDPMAGFRLASGRLGAPPYPPDAEHRRIAQPLGLEERGPVQCIGRTWSLLGQKYCMAVSGVG